MAKCDTCKHKATEDGWAVCDCCIHEPSMGDRYEAWTNAERIRSMTDEELAVFLCDINGCCFSADCPGEKLCTRGDGQANGLKKWLKQLYVEKG